MLQEKYYFKDGQFFINNTETNRSIVLPENEVSIKIMKSNENCNLVILNARGDIINHVSIINDELLSSLTDANYEIANNIDLINYNTEYYLDIINNDFGGKIYDSHEDVYLF
ncbi:MAG: hypothetical protein KTV77_02210 [Wolbachia endosymbiont of Fragariocoptes setiger]|nr:hypothetical protein [Wolbachia endosymbiont of Fragariocoptes setiger]